MSLSHPSQRAVLAFVLSLCLALAATGVCIAFGQAPAHATAVESAALETSQGAAAASIEEGTGS